MQPSQLEVEAAGQLPSPEKIMNSLSYLDSVLYPSGPLCLAGVHLGKCHVVGLWHLQCFGPDLGLRVIDGAVIEHLGTVRPPVQKQLDRRSGSVLCAFGSLKTNVAVCCSEHKHYADLDPGI